MLINKGLNSESTLTIAHTRFGDYTWDANGNLLYDAKYTYTYDHANRLKTVSAPGLSVSYTYNGQGDRVSQTVNGITTNFTLDLNSGLTQVLQESSPLGAYNYLYGAERIAQVGTSSTDYFLADAQGSVRQLTTASGGLTLAKNYTAFGDVSLTVGAGSSRYGYTGEQTDSYIKLIYLRSRYYSPVTGRFQTRDAWQGDYNTPMSYNAWLYGYANPIKYVDPSGFAAISGIEVDDNFSEEEKQLIAEAITDYAALLGGEEELKRNLALAEITIGWLDYNGTFNAQYNPANQTIKLPYGWYSSIIAQSPNGKIHIILGNPCLEEILGFPKGSLPTDEIGAKFILTHEMTHAFATGNPRAFKSFQDNVSLPWSIFAGFSSNPIIKRNAFRSLADEVFADTIPAYLYSQGLLNQEMKDWVEEKMVDTLE